jgi:pimeloyl-ACP methyl ester carboxylesterase
LPCDHDHPESHRTTSAEPDTVWSCFGYGPGVCIRYERQGNGPVPVLMLHGFAASRTTWDDLRERFPADEYTLYLIDLMGFGRSSKPRDADYGPLEQAAIVLAFLAELRLSKTVLVGHSYGGTVALLAALMAHRSAWRHLFAGVVLMGTPAWPQPLPRFFRYLKAPLLGTLLLKLLPNRYVVTRALASVYHDRRLVDDRHRERYAHCFRGKGTLNALVMTVRQMIPDHWEEFCAEYPRLDTPLLLLWGRNDRVVRIRQGEQLRDTVSGARLEIIEACGHNPHEEQPDHCWKMIKGFLEEITAMGKRSEEPENPGNSHT